MKYLFFSNIQKCIFPKVGTLELNMWILLILRIRIDQKLVFCAALHLGKIDLQKFEGSDLRIVFHHPFRWLEYLYISI